MKLHVKILINVIACSFAYSGLSFAQGASDDFGRLFTTPEQRKNLQKLRYSQVKPVVEKEIEIFVEDDVDEKVEPRNIEGITLNGFVYRKDSKSTVWLNGSNSYEGSLASEYLRINTSDMHNNKVSVTVPEVNLEVDLKVGETYDPDNESLLDIIDNGDDIEILRN